MVFIALPALNASQRNTQRKQDVDRFAAAIAKYQAHNGGKVPFYIKRDLVFKNGQWSYVYIGKGDTMDLNFVKRYIDESCSVAHLDLSYKGTTQYPASSDGVSYWGDRHYAFDDCSDQFRDPDGTIYDVVAMNGDSSGYIYGDDVEHMFAVAAGCKCSDEEGKREATGNPNDWLIFMTLEMGQSYCVDNQ